MKMTDQRYGFLLLLTILCLGFSACDTESNTEDPDLNYFIKYYGGDGNQYGVDMALLQDGTLLLVGNYSSSTFDTDIYLVRVDGRGDVLWETRIGDDAATNSVWEARDIEPTNDGNFVILADFRNEAGAQRDLKLIKISPEGAVVASVDFGTSANDFSHTVTPLTDGGFIVSGTSEFTSTYGLAGVEDPDLGDFINYRFDANLVEFSLIDWSPISPGFGGRQDVAVKTVQREGSFQVFGYSNIDLQDTNPEKKLGLFYFQRNYSGSESTPFFPGGSPDEIRINYVHPLQRPFGDGILVVGTATQTLGQSRVFVSKLRSDLTYERAAFDIEANNTLDLGRNIRGVAAASSVHSEFGYLILANEVRSTGATNFWVSKINQTLEPVWSTTFGSEDSDDRGSAVLELPDGRIVILGTVELADNQSKMALVKVNANGKLLR